jgi:hypothetical protein
LVSSPKDTPNQWSVDLSKRNGIVQKWHWEGAAEVQDKARTFIAKVVEDLESTYDSDPRVATLPVRSVYKTSTVSSDESLEQRREIVRLSNSFDTIDDSLFDITPFLKERTRVNLVPYIGAFLSCIVCLTWLLLRKMK